MADSDSRRSVLRPWVRLHFIAAVVLAGLAVGLTWAIDEIWFNRYLQTGYLRNAALEFRRFILVAAAAAAILAVAGTLFKLLAGLVWPASDKVLSVGRVNRMLVAPRIRIGTYLLLFILSAYYFVFGMERYGFTKVGIFFGLVLLVAYTEILAQVLSRMADPEGLRARQITGAVYTVFGLLFLNNWLFRGFKIHFGPGDVQRQMHVAMIFIAALVAAVLVWRHLRTAGIGGNVARRRALMLASVAAAVVVAAAVAPLLAPRQAAANPMNVVLIGIDTLRADHTALLTTPDSGRELTPNLARIAENGVVFSNAISQAPWTLPAFASVMTGEYPHEHGAISFGDFVPRAKKTLAERFREAGYDTAAIVSHIFVTQRHGFGQGFDHFNAKNQQGEKAITSHGVTDAALAWLENHGDEPFFMFLHYFDPHNEYRDHDGIPYADDYAGWINRTTIDLANLVAQRTMLDDTDVAHLKNLYDEEIVYTDRHIGRVLDHLRERGLLENTAVILFSDHGEEFMEHGSIGHTTTLHDELLNVPLMVSLPEAAYTPGSLAPDTVETRDIYNLLVEYAGLGADETRPESLILAHVRRTVAAASSEREVSAEFTPHAFSTVWLPNVRIGSGKRVRLASLRTNTWKLIYDVDRERHFFYDIQADPDEMDNLAAQSPAPFDSMRAQLDAWLARMVAGYQPVGGGAMDEHTIRELESLGYM